MKITVIGGGSTYTPELVEGFARRAEVLGLRELVLYDIDAQRLAIVGGLARRINTPDPSSFSTMNVTSAAAKAISIC